MKMKKKTIFYSVLISFFCVNSLSAQVGIGTVLPHSSTILDVESTTKGFLPPRLANPSAISGPATGLMIYNTTEKCIQVNNGTSSNPIWDCINEGSSSGGTPGVVVNNGVESDCDNLDIKSFGSGGVLGMQGNHIVTEGQNNSLWRFNRYMLSNSGKVYDTWGRMYGESDNVKQNGLNYSMRPSRITNLDAALGSEKVEQMVTSLGVGHANFSYYDVLVLRTDAGNIYSMRMNTGSGGNSYNGPSIRDRFNRPIIGPESRLDSMGLSTDYSNKYKIYPLTGVAGANWSKLLPTSAIIPGTSTSFNAGDRMFAFNSTDNLWYSWGAYVRGSWTAPRFYGSAHIKGDNMLLLRDPADIVESVTPQPATILNKILTDNSTSLYDPENLDFASSGIIYHKQNSDIYSMFLTTDGLLNVVEPDGHYIRYKVDHPIVAGAVDTIIQISYANNYNSGSGVGPIATSYNHMLLAKSGNVYEISLRNVPVLNAQDNTPIDLLSYPVSSYVSEQVYTLAQLDNIKMKYIIDYIHSSETSELLGVSYDGVMYSINKNPGATPPLLSSGVKKNGVVVSSSSSVKYDGYQKASVPKIDKILSIRIQNGGSYNSIYFTEIGTGQIWKYGYADNSYKSTATSTLFDLLLPHQNMTNNIASRTTGINVDSASFIPFYKVSNCSQSYIVN